MPPWRHSAASTSGRVHKGRGHGRPRNQGPHGRVFMPLMRRERLHRAEIFMRLRHLVAREAGVMFPLQAIKHPYIAHRQRQAHDRFHDAGGYQAPARRIIPRLDRRQQPGQRAESEQRGGGRREARPLIQQILESGTGFYAQDIRIRVFRRATEMQPKAIGDGAHPVRPRHLQIGLGDGLALTWACAEPGAALTWGGAGGGRWGQVFSRARTILSRRIFLRSLRRASLITRIASLNYNLWLKYRESHAQKQEKITDKIAKTSSQNGA